MQVQYEMGSGRDGRPRALGVTSSMGGMLPAAGGGAPLQEKLSGEITKWDDEKGFGFIAPSSGGDDIFCHRTDIISTSHRPQLACGMQVQYEMGSGRDRRIGVDRPRALSVTNADGTPIAEGAAMGLGGGTHSAVARPHGPAPEPEPELDPQPEPEKEPQEREPEWPPQQVVLITGAATGIGAALARRMAAPGRRFLLTTRSSVDALAAVAQDVREAGAEAEVCLSDLADGGAAASLVATCSEKFGGLDLLVSNAGFADATPFEEQTLEGMTRAFNTMALSFFELTQAALPLLRRSSQPRVVAISSFITHRFHDDSLFASSAAAKAALESVAKTLARVAAPDGIPVNIVAPGHVEKDKAIGTDAAAARRASVAARVPMGRIATPADIVGPILFLLSPDAGYLTGTTLHVDGGLATL